MKKLFIKITSILIFCTINIGVNFAQQLSIPLSNACLNDTAIVPVSFSNIDSLAALTLYVSYDTAVLSYAGFDNINALTPGIMCGVPTAGPNAWQVVVSWVDNTLNGVNLVSGTLCNLKFKYKGGNSNLNFLSASELVKPNLNNISMVYSNGNLTSTILTHPTSTQICEMGQTSFSVSAVSGSTYQWQVQNTAQWEDLQNNTTYSGVNTNTLQVLQALYALNSKVYRCMVTKTCSQYSNTAVLSVYQKPLIVLNNDTTICIGNSVVVNANGTTGTGTLLYSWDQGLGLGIAHTVSPAVNTTYHLTVTDANVCSSFDSIIVFVNQVPSVAGIINGNTSLCQGVNGIAYTVPAITHASSYTWTLPTGATGTSTTNNISVNYSTSAISGAITVRGNNTCGIGATSSLTITVNPLPSLTNLLTANTCSGTGPNINLTASTSSNFAWTIGAITGAITGATAGSGTLINQILTNSVNTAAGTVHYIVTPTSTTGSCVGNTATITVTVNPIPVVTNSANTVSCSGTSPNIVLTSSVSSIFTWNIGTITGGITGAIAGSGTSINQILTNPSNTTSGTVQYLITPTSVAGVCAGTTFTITITVNPAPAVTNVATASICSGTSPNIALTSSLPSNFVWTIGTITAGITGATAGSGAIISQVLGNPGNTTSGTVQYIVTPTSTANSCTGSPYTITVTVNPLPAVTNAATVNICSGSGTNINLLASTASNFAWSIGSITAGITGATSGSGATINQILTNPSNATSGTVQYLVIPTSVVNACSGATFTITVTVNPIPVVTNAATAATCSGTSANITLTSSVASNFAWTIGTITAGITGATAASGTVINQVLTNPNTTAGTVQYLVIPTSTGNSCVGATFTITVTVNPLPAVAGSISGLTTVCQGQTSVTYTVSAITNATSYVWNLPTGVSGSSTTNTITVNYSASAATGSITVKGHNSCGDGVLSTLSITVNSLPSSASAINGLAILCQGQSGVTYNVAAIPNATSYIWTLPTGASGTSTTNTITVNYSTSAVSGNISVKGSNACGIGNSSVLGITVDHPITATVGVITGLTVVCQGQTAVSYNVPVITNATSYIWTLPTGASGSSVTSTISVNYSLTASSGDIVVKGSNSCGIGDSSILAITVNPLVAAAGTISGTTTVCQGQTGVTYNVPAIANATSYSWTLPLGANGSSSTSTITVSYSNTAISGKVVVKGNNSCGIGDSSFLVITVNPLPAAAAAITSVNNDSVSINENSVLYTVPVITNATTYIWAYSGSGITFVGGNTTTTNNVTINFSATASSGNLSVKGHNACGDGVVSANYPIWVSPVGIGELANPLNCRIYPNPGKGIIYIELDMVIENCELFLYNMQGETIYSEGFSSHAKPMVKEINLSKYPKGIYFIKIKNNKFVKVEKLILQ